MSMLFYTQDFGITVLKTDLTALRTVNWTPPPLAAYEEWVGMNPSRSSRFSLSPSQIRRIVIMTRHEGLSPGVAAIRLGKSRSTGASLFKRLPSSLT